LSRVFDFDTFVTDLEQHIRYGIERVERFGHNAQDRLTLKEIKRIFSSWRLWIFVASYV
jgi:ACS family pantothenate transporter-like MFS transporter